MRRDLRGKKQNNRKLVERGFQAARVRCAHDVRSRYWMNPRQGPGRGKVNEKKGKWMCRPREVGREGYSHILQGGFSMFRLFPKVKLESFAFVKNVQQRTRVRLIVRRVPQHVGRGEASPETRWPVRWPLGRVPGQKPWHLRQSSSSRDAEEAWVWAHGEHGLASRGGWRKRNLTSAIGSGGESIKGPPQKRMSRLWGLGWNEETQLRAGEARGWGVRKVWTHGTGSPGGGSPRRKWEQYTGKSSPRRLRREPWEGRENSRGWNPPYTERLFEGSAK